MGIMDKINGLERAVNSLDSKLSGVSSVGGNLLQGMMGNLSVLPSDVIMQKYGAYLMKDESVKVGYILIRDIVIFSDKRILYFDKQGLSAQKMHIASIYLDSIINVSAETAGFGFDDSEISIEYICSPYYRAHSGISVETKKFEFPKNYQIQPIYQWLQEVAYANHMHINA